MSVVICTRDRADQLERCLQTVLDQSLGTYEVLVVDNAPATDETRRLLAAMADPRLRYLHEGRPGLSCARNTGVAAAQGQIVAFTDDDVRVDRDWLLWLTMAFTRGPRVGVVTGLVPTAEIETRAQAIFDAKIAWAEQLAPRLYDLRENHPGTPFFPYSAGIFGTGANFALLRSAIDEVGPFDEALGAGTPAAGGEDLDIFLRTIRSGWTLAYEPAAIAWHLHRREMDGVARQLRGYGIGLGAYTYKHVTNRQTAPELAHLIPSALWRLVTERRSSPAGQTIPLSLRAAEIAGLGLGPVAYIRGRLRWADARARRTRPTP